VTALEHHRHVELAEGCRNCTWRTTDTAGGKRHLISTK
jgi:hypothetical protein